MGLEEDDENVVYGTRLVHEEDLGRKKGKVALSKGQARTAAPWQQEVTDAEGRRRFHGAFTGGFSAGYYNTVGSKEGWTPSTFVSSRNQRASGKGQTVYDFLDDDEKEELKLKELLPSTEYNSLGSTAEELSRRNASSEIELWSAVVPGLVPDEIIDASQSIGVKLLKKMGWRQEFSVEADRIAFPSVVNNRRGLGVVTLKSDDGNQAEIDTVQDDDAESGKGALSKRSISKPSRKKNCLPSFTPASDSSVAIHPLRLPNPVVPADFNATHVLPAPLDVEQYLTGPEPPEVASPSVESAKAINAVASFVAKSGSNYEDNLKQRHLNNPQFAFLFEGGTGHEYYVRRLWENQRSLSTQVTKPILPRSDDRSRKALVGANRGEILGEKRLPRTEVAVASSALTVRDETPSLERASAAAELTAQMNTRFTAGALDTQLTWAQESKQASDPGDVAGNPRRVETPWRPTALLCRRFNIADPYTGKEKILPKQVMKPDPLTNFANLLAPEPRPSKPATTNAWAKEDPQSTQDTPEAQGTIISEESTDLYKAIFSDDDDEDDDERGRAPSSVKPAPAAALAPRDAAGEFLASLGKELGLRV